MDHMKEKDGNTIRIKILCLGPSKSGKSTISNYLAESIELRSLEYHPTQGTRIVEFESSNLKLNDQLIEAEVELWDCSGDPQFKRCWPIIKKGAHGIMFVCNPENDKGSDLVDWYNDFVKPLDMNLNSIIVFLHHTSDNTNDSAVAAFQLPKQLSGVTVMPTNIDNEGENLRYAFNNFLCNIITSIQNNPIPIDDDDMEYNEDISVEENESDEYNESMPDTENKTNI
ncbi:Intraflagellar transport protein 22 homolog [Strongyloides ratti]|uniref:Intraflagellar transport protein 22 homolog n=1 Tax=Strongyloides ratti TaxID=34506 RepID=A0A090LMU7_STRRB|nr:Intraflagellar transport protein 22 homolog [Strongyloides ratti]CEF71160.1 Intraflagellar transport protein 22 homolog [Strongyloides ratti]